MTHDAQSRERHPPRRGYEAHPAHPDVPRAAGLHRKLSPDEINRLELASYRGPVHVVHTPDQVLAAVAALRHETVLGFDTETRPSFKKGESHPPALMQLAGESAVYVFQLHAIGLPVELAQVLSDPRITKAGVAIARDLRELRTLTEFEPHGFVDVGTCAAKSGVQHHGLRGLAALLLGCRISKSAQLTNWERADLPPPALRYAATDAWISRRIYEALRDLGRIGAGVAPAPAQKAPKGGLWHRAKAAVGRIARGTVRQKWWPASGRHPKTDPSNPA